MGKNKQSKPLFSVVTNNRSRNSNITQNRIDKDFLTGVDKNIKPTSDRKMKIKVRKAEASLPLHGRNAQALNEFAAKPGSKVAPINGNQASAKKSTQLSIASVRAKKAVLMPNHNQEIAIRDFDREIEDNVYGLLKVYEIQFINYIKMIYNQRDQLLRGIEAEKKKNLDLITEKERLSQEINELATLGINKLQSFITPQ